MLIVSPRYMLLRSLLSCTCLSSLGPRHVGESGLSLSEDVGVGLFLDSLAVESQDFQGLFPALKDGLYLHCDHLIHVMCGEWG